MENDATHDIREDVGKKKTLEMSGTTKNQNNEAVISNFEMVVTGQLASWTGVKCVRVVGTVNPHSTLHYNTVYLFITLRML